MEEHHRLREPTDPESYRPGLAGTDQGAKGNSSTLADTGTSGCNPGQADPVSEQLLKLPIPSERYVLIVTRKGNSYAASEIPRAAFTDPVLLSTFTMMDEQMENSR